MGEWLGAFTRSASAKHTHEPLGGTSPLRSKVLDAEDGASSGTLKEVTRPSSGQEHDKHSHGLRGSVRSSDEPSWVHLPNVEALALR